MSTNNDGSKYVYMALVYGAFAIFCSWLRDFDILDLLYLIVITNVFIQYRLICRKEKRNQ